MPDFLRIKKPFVLQNLNFITEIDIDTENNVLATFIKPSEEPSQRNWISRKVVLHPGFTGKDAADFIEHLNQAVSEETGLYIDCVSISEKMYLAVAEKVYANISECLQTKAELRLDDIYTHLETAFVDITPTRTTYTHISSELNRLGEADKIELSVDRYSGYRSNIPTTIKDFEKMYINKKIEDLRIKVKEKNESL